MCKPNEARRPSPTNPKLNPKPLAMACCSARAAKHHRVPPAPVADDTAGADGLAAATVVPLGGPSEISLGQLLRKCTELGVSDAAVAEAIDGPRPKVALSALVHATTTTAAAAGGADGDQEAGLRRELGGLKVSQLRARAAAAGLGAELILDALDDDVSPKDALIDLIAAAVPPQRSAGGASGGAAGGDGRAAAEKALRAELGKLKVSALRRRAVAAAVDEEELDEVMDADNPRNTLVDLIVARAEEVDSAGGEAAAGAEVRARLVRLRAELDGTKGSEVRKRAVAAGMPVDQLDCADDSANPKAVFADFLMGCEGGHGGAPTAKPDYMYAAAKPHFGVSNHPVVPVASPEPQLEPARAAKHAMLSYQW